MADKTKILVVEDEEPIRQGLTDVFVYHGYEVEGASDGEEGLQKALTGEYDLILLDVMMPKLDGFSVCNQIREVNRDQPIIMLTAKSADEDIMTGLTLGADDYVTKPFSLELLLLRAKAVLRRSNREQVKERILKVGNAIEIDTANLKGQLLDKNESIPFTRREIDLLIYLKNNNDRPVSREELLVKVWGYKNSMDVETRTVDIHIAKLRRKIEEDAKNPQLLVTVRGEGYKLEGNG